MLRKIWIARGHVCRALGRCDQAREAYRSAGEISIGKKPRAYDMVSYGLMVGSYLKQDMLEEAEPLLKEWIERFPQERLMGLPRCSRRDCNWRATTATPPSPNWIRF